MLMSWEAEQDAEPPHHHFNEHPPSIGVWCSTLSLASSPLPLAECLWRDAFRVYGSLPVQYEYTVKTEEWGRGGLQTGGRRGGE
ncbi:hypothetical protein PBY51_021918 [Eleginops maclovinus]|uniref:Uncharacterized protein n=1 Tax=Eleginops maclovinus TaxID=56733 RepID=A0AAN8AMI4_ELEMC|nr:hypothetical protein PBY51_021918 [Eleginops maclovinus]